MKNTKRMTTRTKATTKTATANRCADMTSTRTILPQDLPKKIVCSLAGKTTVRRGTLPPGLEKRLQPCPEDLERRLPLPPPECAHVLVGGHIVLLNRRTNVVVDFVHFEVR
jgi:hypothetical protein